MKFRVTKKQITHIGIPVAVAIALCVGFITGLYSVRSTLADIRLYTGELSARTAALEERLALLSGDTETLRMTVVQSDEEREQGQEILQEKLGLLTGNLDIQETRIKEIVQTADISGLAAQWSPFVYRLTCSFKNGQDEDLETSKGSAVLEHTPVGVRLITNRHVLERDEARLTGCTLSTLDGDTEIDIRNSDIVLSEDVDFGYARISDNLSAMFSFQKCAEKPHIGDPVLILGYPAIGAKESITATEGIISGFDEEYYTTSAKIERGNSGGAAVDIERNCFLGLPTLVVSGRIESLARILPVSSF